MRASLFLSLPPSEWDASSSLTPPGAVHRLQHLLTTDGGVWTVPGLPCGHGSFGVVMPLHSVLYPQRTCVAKLFRPLSFTRAALDSALAAAQQSALVIDAVTTPDCVLDKICREAVLLWTLQDAHDEGSVGGESRPHAQTVHSGARHVLAYYGLSLTCAAPSPTSPSTSSGVPEMAPHFSDVLLLMENLTGGTLPDCVQRHTTACSPLPAVHLQVWFSQALQAFVYLHERHQILHRDVKPGNMMMRLRTDVRMSPRPESALPASQTALDGAELVLIDFGESVRFSAQTCCCTICDEEKATDVTTVPDEKKDEEAAQAVPAPASLGVTGAATAAAAAAAAATARTVMGTEGFCAPELAGAWGCAGRTAYGPSADLWSLAASFYVLLVQGPEACGLGMAALLRARSCGQGDGVEASNGPLALLLVACGAYPSLRALILGDTHGMGECTRGPASPHAALPSQRASWSWARAQSTEASSGQSTTGQTFFADDTSDQATDVLTGAAMAAVAMMTAHTRVSASASLSPTLPRLATQSWGRQVLAWERMADYFVSHHYPNNNHNQHDDEDDEDDKDADDATRSRSLLEASQRRLSDAFIDVLDALMTVAPQTRPCARHALVRFATLRAWCRRRADKAADDRARCRDAAAPAEVRALSPSASPFWADTTFVVSLVLSQRACLGDHVRPLLRTVLAPGQTCGMDGATLSCTVLLLRALPSTRRSSVADSALAAHLAAHSDTLETTCVLLVTVEWRQALPQPSDTAHARASSLEDRFTTPRVSEALAQARSALVGYHAMAPSQVLLASGAQMSACPSGASSVAHSAQSLSSSFSTMSDNSCLIGTGEGSCVQHGTWHLLYALARPPTDLGASVMLGERAVLRELQANVEDARHSLQVVASTAEEENTATAALPSRMRAIVARWSLALQRVHEALEVRLRDLDAATESGEFAHPSVDLSVFYLVAPPSAKALLDALLCMHTDHQTAATQAGDVLPLDAFVRHWLTHAPYILATPC